VLRGWLIVGAIAEGPPGSGGLDFPIPRVADNTLVGLAALMLVIPVSVILGRQAQVGQRRGLNVALTLFGALFCHILPASASDNSGDASTFPIASTTRSVAGELVVYDSAGNGYRVLGIRTSPDGRAVAQALCPADVANQTRPELRTANGTPVVCVGVLSPNTSQPLAAPVTAPTATVAPATTAPVSTAAESTR
jgi:hypothetical protein